MRWGLFESTVVEETGQQECFTRLCCILAVSHSILTVSCLQLSSNFPAAVPRAVLGLLAVSFCVWHRVRVVAIGKGAHSSSFPSSGGRWKSWARMSEGISAARTSACLFCIFYILFLLFILVPFLFSSWFISPPPVLFLPEEQHYPLLSLCTIFYFFPLCILLRSSLVSTRCAAPEPAGGELQQGSPPMCLPPTTAPLHLLLQEKRVSQERR